MAHIGTIQRTGSTGSTGVAPAIQALLVAGALIYPPLLMLAVGITLGEGHESLRALDTVPIVGPAALNALYLVFAALLARRRLWMPSIIVLVVPLPVFWYVASLLQD